MQKFSRYAEISKVEDQDDGTIKVWGYASSGAEDTDGEVITPEAMKAALPDYLKFGAVREMHGKNAAGTAIEATVEEDGRTFFGAHVVDPVAVKKVQAKVYKGFSVGGNVLARDKVAKNTITELRLIEISLVDRPANPEAIFTMYKAETVAETDPPAVDPPADPAAADADAKAAQAAADTAAETAKAERAQIQKADRDAIASIADLLDKRELSAVALLALAKASIEKAKGKSDDDDDDGDSPQTAASMEADKATDKANAASAATRTDSTQHPEAVSAHKKAATKHREAARAYPVDSTPSKAHEDKARQHDDAATAHSYGYGSGVSRSDSPGDLLKAATSEKADEALAKALDTIGALEKRLAAIEAQPLPAKGVTRVVEKVDDGRDPSAKAAELDPVRKHDGSVDDAATEFKKAFAAGRTVPIGFRPPLA